MSAYEFVPAIPCRVGTDGLRVYWFRNWISGPGTAFTPRGGYQWYVDCWSSTAGRFTITGPAPTTADFDATGVSDGRSAGSLNVTSGCPNVVEIRISASGVLGSTQLAPSPMKWTPRQWSQKGSDGGWNPADNVNDVTPPGVELPIQCPINTSGADIVAVTINVWNSFLNLPPCLFIPAGWDRASRIEAEWNRGAVGDMTDAYQAAVPNGLACGVLATFPTIGGGTFVVDTCQADFASSLVKTVVGWVIVLGLAVLSVRRIVWAIGSKA